MKARRVRDDSGATAVEFALVSIPFILLVIGMIQFGWYFYVSQTTGGAASNVVRELQVGDCWGANEALNRAKDQSPTVTDVDILPNQTTPPEPGTDLTVTVTADARIIGLLPMPGGGMVEKTVHARAEDKSPGAC
jgi:Flp pilus assembly protein TadG